MVVYHIHVTYSIYMCRVICSENNGRWKCQPFYVHVVLCIGSKGRIGWTLFFSGTFWSLVAFILCRILFLHQERCGNRSFLWNEVPYSTVRHQQSSGSSLFDIGTGNKNVLKCLEVFWHSSYKLRQFKKTVKYVMLTKHKIF